jgi:predicted 3-demethylubiquinone-9 3-methyltransferase (glyoxalase superfamily)
MPTITTFLMFNQGAEAAVARYKEVFPQTRALGPLEFEIEGQRFAAFNGGPHFKFSEAISIMVSCDGQAEIDRYWDALLAEGGKPSRCGWLTDAFGVSWQIVPRNIRELISTKAGVAAMMSMQKLDIATLQAASSQ